MSRMTNVEDQTKKTANFAMLYGSEIGSVKKPTPKTAAELANERWHLAEHIRANSLPTAVGSTHDLVDDSGEPDVYALLTYFLFDKGLIQKTGEAEFFPTYAVLSNGRLIPYDLDSPGTEDENLLVWI